MISSLFSYPSINDIFSIFYILFVNYERKNYYKLYTGLPYSYCVYGMPKMHT